MFTRAFVLWILCLPAIAAGKTVSYEFDIDTLPVNMTGTEVIALTIGGQIPAPLIEAEVGDILRATFHNRLPITTAVHWHGLLLPNMQDGVPHLNTHPIAAGGSHTFEFPIIQKGTYWYHSHMDMQIQRGVYGAIILTDPADHREMIPENIEEVAVLFSDWTNEDPMSVLGNLKRDDDFYSFKKDTTQSWDRVIASGSAAIQNRVRQSFTRMAPMDLADVGYDAFLVNGVAEAQITVADPAAQQIMLRLINGSTSSYFDVEYAGGPMLLVAADGEDVEPILVQRLRMATAETYDVLVPVAAASAFELRATSVDGSGHSSMFIGNGQRLLAPDIPAPNLFLMDHANMTMDSHGSHTELPVPNAPGTHAAHAPVAVVDDHAAHAPVTAVDDHAGHLPAEHTASLAVIEHMTDYQYLIARDITTLPPANQWREIDLRVTGDMSRYIWSFNDETQRDNPQILIRKGENVRFNLTNTTMMNHPLHLHGHFFRVVNEHGERSPLKNTANIPPSGSIVIEFEANEEQDWLFHCHNQFHMETGMNRVLSYEQTSIFTADMAQAILPHMRWFDSARLNSGSNYTEIEYSLFEEHHELRLHMDSDFNEGHEVKAKYLYHFNRFFSAFTGMENKQHENMGSESVGIAGFNYKLPLLIDSEWRVDDAGEFRLELESELQLTRRIAFDWRWNTDNEYRYSLQYSLDKRWAITWNNDSEYGDGVGIQLQF